MRKLIKDNDLLYAAITRQKVFVLREHNQRIIKSYEGIIQSFSNSFVKINSQFFVRDNNYFVLKPRK